jgi:hypothetical protein
VAAVTTPASTIPVSPFTCIDTTTCPIGTPIENAVCCQPGIPKKDYNNTTVTLTCRDSSGTVLCSGVTAGGEITVSVTSTFYFIVGNSPWPWSKSMDFTNSASMRYEG